MAKVNKSMLLVAALGVSVLALGGCKSGSSGGTISKQDEDMMRRPAGSVPMPPEAARAMQNAGRPGGGGGAPAAGAPAANPPGPGAPR